MKLIILLFFALAFFVQGYLYSQSDSLHYPKNRIVLAVNIAGFHESNYHTFGYERSFHIYKGLYLGGYAGIGYLPSNSKKLFTQYLGFEGSGFYTQCLRATAKYNWNNWALITGFEYSHIVGASVVFNEDKHLYALRCGTEHYFLKKHLLISPTISLGNSLIQEGFDTSYDKGKFGKIGLDIGFCF